VSSRLEAHLTAGTLGNTNSEIGSLTISNPPTQDKVRAFARCLRRTRGRRASAFDSLVHALRTALVNAELIKGAA